MTRPSYSPQISLGNILTFAAMIVAGGIAFGVVQSRTAGNAEDIDRIEALVQAQEMRIRVNENNVARGDERLTSIFQLLSRIDARLERIEGRRD